MGFKTTTHDWCIYRIVKDGEVIYLLRMVDNMVTACVNEKTAKDIYNIIGEKMSFPSEKEEGIVPFEYLGIVKDYNGVGIQQTSHYIEMNCENYIQRLNRTHGWEPQDKASPSDDESTTAAAASVDIPVNENILNLLTKPEQSKDS